MSRPPDDSAFLLIPCRRLSLARRSVTSGSIGRRTRSQGWSNRNLSKESSAHQCCCVLSSWLPRLHGLGNETGRPRRPGTFFRELPCNPAIISKSDGGQSGRRNSYAIAIHSSRQFYCEVNPSEGPASLAEMKASKNPTLTFHIGRSRRLEGSRRSSESDLSS